MTRAALVAVLKAYLTEEGLVLCKNADTAAPLDGFREAEVLMKLAEVVEQLEAVPEWVSDAPTAPTKVDVLGIFSKAEE